jgi:hypothetical protein
MVDRESQEYFRRRELAERAAAKYAASPAARRAHQELAQGYARLLHDTGRGSAGNTYMDRAS